MLSHTSQILSNADILELAIRQILEFFNGPMVVKISGLKINKDILISYLDADDTTKYSQQLLINEISMSLAIDLKKESRANVISKLEERISYMEKIYNSFNNSFVNRVKNKLLMSQNDNPCDIWTLETDKYGKAYSPLLANIYTDVNCVAGTFFSTLNLISCGVSLEFYGKTLKRYQVPQFDPDFVKDLIHKFNHDVTLSISSLMHDKNKVSPRASI